MSLPILKIELTKLDWIIEAITVFVILGIVIYTLMEYSALPDKVVTHFGANGKSDATGSKSTVWLLVGVIILLYSLLTTVSRFPHKFNYPMRITEGNAKRHYTLTLQMMRFVKLQIVLSFAYITYISINNPESNNSGLGSWFLPVTLISLFGIIIFYIVKSSINES